MQLITSISKYLVLAVLSCVLFLAWNSNNINMTYLSLSDTNTSVSESLNSKPADSIWNSIRRDFKLDHKVQSSRVQAEIHKLLADQDKLYEILKAAAPYIYFIQQQTRARGLPAEIALIPFVESEFNPYDRSHKGATGLWQLMSGTARELGVKVRSGYDGRRNVIASTKAALAYFNDLGNYFKGNWYLAIAAYNCGQGRVDSEKRRAGSDSYWNLHLPQETKLYVPKLLAVAAIVSDPKKYGVELPPINNQPYFTEVKVQKSVDLTKVAKASGVNVETLHTLNPDYNHGKASAVKTNTLLVPIDKASTIKAKLQDNHTTARSI